MAVTKKTTGAITGLRTAKPADKRGPKSGSAMSNQSAKYVPDAATKAEISKEAKSRRAPAVKHNPDTITGVASPRSGPPSTILETKKADGSLGKCLVIPQNRFVGEVTKLAKIGMSLKAVEQYLATHKPDAKLANGITSRDAPHSAKHVADAAAAKGKPAPAAKTTKAAAKPAAKASKGKVEDTAKLTFVAPNPKKPGTATFDRYKAAYKVGRTVADVLKHTTRADIDWDLKRGFIKL